MHISSGETRLWRFGAFVDQSVTDAFFGELLKVRLNCRSWSDSSDRHQPGQIRHPPISNVVRHFPYARESCVVISLPLQRGMIAEPKAEVLPDDDLSFSSL